MSAEVESMAYADKTPWHGEGVNLGKDDVDAKTMMKASGLSKLKVAFAPNQCIIDGVAYPHENSQAIYRTDTKAILAPHVSNGFGLLQPHEHFDFFDAVIGGGVNYHTAGILSEGKKVWILVKIPNTFEVVKGDVVEAYILLSDSYAGDGKSFNVQHTPIRVVCKNTLNIALGGGEGKTKYRLVHKKNISDKLDAQDASEILGLAGVFYDGFKDAMQHLVSIQMNEAEMVAFVNLLAPIPQTKLAQHPEFLMLPAPKQDEMMELITPQLRRKRETILELIHSGRGNDKKGIRGTAYAAFQGATEFADFGAGRDGTRYESLLFGSNRALKQRAFDLLIDGVAA